MAVIVNSGSTVTVTPSPGLTLTADSTIEAGGVLQGAGTVSGAFELLNLGDINGQSGGLTIATGSFDNQGLVEANLGGNLSIGASVNFLDNSNGTLTAGTWYSSGGVLSVPGPAITVDDATIILSNGGTLNAGSASVLNSLTQIGTAGALTLSAMSQSFLSGPFIDSGVLSVDFTDLTVAGLTVSAGGRLILHAGSFHGALTLNGVLEMAPVGLSINLPGTIVGTGTIQVDSGALVPIIGPTTLTQTLVNNGNVMIQNAGPGSGVTIASSPVGSGEIDVLAGTLELAGDSGNAISFDRGSVATVVLDNPGSFTGTIVGMANNINTVVLDGVIGDTATLNGASVLSVMNGAGTVATFNLVPLSPISHFAAGQDYSNAIFTATSNVAANNTTITVSGVTSVFQCFRSGTQLATPAGDVPVERLDAGDLVRTWSGKVRRIIWTGQRTVDLREHALPSRLWPVRISPGAFGPDQPYRDLFLSPNHAVFVCDVLIPIRCLLNGKTIRQIAVDRVTYHHIELEEHDIVIAEGLAAESYLDHGDRGFFADGEASVRAFPDLGAGIWEMTACAPLVVTGPVLVEARAMIEKRASNLVAARAVRATANVA